MDTVGERLKWARETAGLTTRQLATLASVSDAYPSALECGRVGEPSLDKIDRIAGVLEVPFDWLARGVGQVPSERKLKAHGARLKAKTEGADSPAPPTDPLDEAHTDGGH